MSASRAGDKKGRRTAFAVRRPRKRPARTALPVLILRLAGLLGLDQQQRNKYGDEAKQHDKPGEIEFHGKPPEMFS